MKMVTKGKFEYLGEFVDLTHEMIDGFDFEYQSGIIIRFTLKKKMITSLTLALVTTPEPNLLTSLPLQPRTIHWAEFVMRKLNRESSTRRCFAQALLGE